MTQYRDFNPNTKVRVKTSKTKTVAAPTRRTGALQDVARGRTLNGAPRRITYAAENNFPIYVTLCIGGEKRDYVPAA